MSKTDSLQCWLENMGIRARVHYTDDGVIVEMPNYDYLCNQERLARWFVLKQTQNTQVMLTERRRGLADEL